MTRYDPFAHGQVKFDAGKSAPPRDEEDMLFAGGDTVKQGPPADGSWELLKVDVANLLPNAKAAGEAEMFGSDILGEDAPAFTPAAPTQRRAEPAAPRPKSPNVTQEKKPAPTSPRAAPAAAPRVGVRTPPPVEATVPAESPATSPVAPAKPKPPARRRSVAARSFAPLTMFVVGGAGAAWLGLMEQNVVMAAIVGCLTLVAAAFAQLWLRE